MNITNISNLTATKATENKSKAKNPSYASFNNVKPDSFSFSGLQADNIIKFKQTAKTIHVVSFTGLNDPTPVAIQFKVRGVTRFQDDYEKVITGKCENSGKKKDSGNFSNEKTVGKQKLVLIKREQASIFPTWPNLPKSLDSVAPGSVSSKPINKLAASDWEDGKALKFNQAWDNGKTTISDPEFGQIGFVPDELEEKLKEIGQDYTSPQRRLQNFRLELSNLVAGTTKGAKTTGVRVNLIYIGKDPEVKEKVEKVFNEILNDEKSNDMVFLYQQKVNPDQVLEKIFENDKINNNVKASEEAKMAITNIVDVIDDPENQNFLFIGHSKPDGDTSGCVLGLESAVHYKYPNKNVDCAIDDKIPGLFRTKLPGIEEIKRPFGKNKIIRMNQTIEQLKLEGSKSAMEKIEILEDEKKSLSNPANLISRNKKYDVIVLMDIPTPKRFTDEFKEQIEGAKKVIYIDHHPHRLSEWQEAKDVTGIDMEQIHKNGLAWVADAVPAATQQIAIIAKKLIPDMGEQKYKDLSKDKQEKLDAFVASTVVGMSTDTGSFTRTANLLPEHMSLPAQQRPNFMPEGLSKWLMGLSDKINKKWLREEISYDIPDTKIPNLDETSRDQMVGFAEDGKRVFENLSLGVMEVNYDDMFTVWKSAMKSDKILQKNFNEKTEFLDIQNAFKGSEVMGLFRSDPAKRPPEKKDYKGKFDNDRIAVLICQDKKAGELDEKYNLATQNGLRLSFRSGGGSDHGELLANLFAGGGHGGASGGRVDLPGVEIDSKLSVTINGKKETNSKAIYNTLRSNVDVRNDKKLSDSEKYDATAKIELAIDKSGKTCTELIEAMTTEIRKDCDEVSYQKPKNSKNGKQSFRGNFFLDQKVS